MTVGEKLIETIPTTETVGVDDPNATYSNDTGAFLVHLVAQPEKNYLELTTSGYTAGFDCGGHLLMNDKAMIIRANLNYYLSCSPTDVNGSTGDRQYDETLDKQIFCFDVSGNVPAIEENLDLCVAEGLIDEDETDPAEAPRFNITTLNRSNFKTWYASKMWTDFTGTDAIPTYLVQPAAPMNNGNDTPEGEFSYSFLFTESADTTEAMTSACNAIPATGATISASYTYSVADFFAETLANSKKWSQENGGETVSDDEYNASTLRNLTAGVAAATNKPKIKVSGVRTIGTSYTTNVTATATVKLDGVSLGTVDLTTPTNELTTLVEGEAEVDLSAIKQTSTITVDISGTTTLVCTTASSTKRTAKFDVGVPRLRFDWKQLPDE